MVLCSLKLTTSTRNKVNMQRATYIWPSEVENDCRKRSLSERLALGCSGSEGTQTFYAYCSRQEIACHHLPSIKYENIFSAKLSHFDY